ncbi:hypothetical protein KFE25_004330 [Diacronema lutheri]|uniref:Uncharacterized protein n=1 Tax=Diacronema lutheri TaxID=2081491 RepID=A0A8J6C137_DIALT|nr:hypothetical protein KFE25_004330 [Diacronema lutheri]
MASNALLARKLVACVTSFALVIALIALLSGGTPYAQLPRRLLSSASPAPPPRRSPTAACNDACDSIFNICEKGCGLLPPAQRAQCGKVCKSARDACKKIPPCTPTPPNARVHHELYENELPF